MTDHPRFSNDDQTGPGTPETRSQLSADSDTRGQSMPTSAIVAIVLQLSITLCLIGLSLVILLETDQKKQVGPAIWPFLLTRLAVAVGVLIGLSCRKYLAFKVSRGLCTLGLIIGGLVIIFILTVGVTALHEYELLIVAGAHCLVWLALLACLHTKSAAKWFTK